MYNVSVPVVLRNIKQSKERLETFHTVVWNVRCIINSRIYEYSTISGMIRHFLYNRAKRTLNYPLQVGDSKTISGSIENISCIGAISQENIVFVSMFEMWWLICQKFIKFSYDGNEYINFYDVERNMNLQNLLYLHNFSIRQKIIFLFLMSDYIPFFEKP